MDSSMYNPQYDVVIRMDCFTKLEYLILSKVIYWHISGTVLLFIVFSSKESQCHSIGVLRFWQD